MEDENVPDVGEPIDVPPSEDNGNMPVDAPDDGGNGVPPVTPPNPADTTPPADPFTPPVASELYELPDGRKVDAATVLQEYKNLLPDYTRKSQALAAKERAGDPNIITNPTSPFADPNYVPQSYEELAKAIRDNTIAELEAREQSIRDERQALEDSVKGQLNEIKTTDPNLNENALLLHATKYRFPNLKDAHQNMKDMNEMAKNVKQATAKDIQRRGDPVSVSPGATGVAPNPGNFATAVDYFRAIGR